MILVTETVESRKFTRRFCSTTSESLTKGIIFWFEFGSWILFLPLGWVASARLISDNTSRPFFCSASHLAVSTLNMQTTGPDVTAGHSTVNQSINTSRDSTDKLSKRRCTKADQSVIDYLKQSPLYSIFKNLLEQIGLTLIAIRLFILQMAITTKFN